MQHVVILDNCAIHHVAPVTQLLINEVGAIVHYLPPYSPIEWCFSKVKEGIDEEMEATEDIELIARSAFATNA